MVNVRAGGKVRERMAYEENEDRGDGYLPELRKCRLRLFRTEPSSGLFSHCFCSYRVFFLLQIAGEKGFGVTDDVRTADAVIPCTRHINTTNRCRAVGRRYKNLRLWQLREWPEKETDARYAINWIFHLGFHRENSTCHFLLRFFSFISFSVLYSIYSVYVHTYIHWYINTYTFFPSFLLNRLCYFAVFL